MSIAETNKKRRVAIDYYKRKLETDGYVVREGKDPVDLFAEKGHERLEIKIKVTNGKDRCFGAVTFVTWRRAFNNPDSFKFVIIWLDDEDEVVHRQEYSPKELLPCSSISPFKVNFSISCSANCQNKRRKNHLTEEKNNAMIEFFQRLSEM